MANGFAKVIFCDGYNPFRKESIKVICGSSWNYRVVLSYPAKNKVLELCTCSKLSVSVPILVACENSRPSSLPARVTFRVKDVCDSLPKIPY